MQESLDFLEKYEAATVKKRQHQLGKFSEQIECGDVNLDARSRGQLSLFFNAWLLHNNRSKQ